MDDAKKWYREEDLGKGRFIVLTLSECGGEYFKRDQGQREVFYITSTETGCLRGILNSPPRLFGIFIFEMEGGDQRRSNFFVGKCQKTRGIICYDGQVEDLNISSHGRLTKTEEEETKNRLEALAEKYPEHSEALKKILQDLQNQCAGVMPALPQKRGGRKKFNRDNY